MNWGVNFGFNGGLDHRWGYSAEVAIEEWNGNSLLL